MKIKSLVAATILSISAASSFAVDRPLSFIGNTATFGATGVGEISDKWSFFLPTASIVGASVTNVAISFYGLSSSGGMTGFSAMLDNTLLTLGTSSYTTSGVTVNTQVLAGGLTATPGLHTLRVFGNGGDFGASYGGSIVAAPVPEPETYAMMLVGLGLMGAVARRRAKSNVV